MAGQCLRKLPFPVLLLISALARKKIFSIGSFLGIKYQHQVLALMTPFFCSADLPMNFEERVSAVEVATRFQENCGEVFKMVEEEMEYAKTQVTLL